MREKNRITGQVFSGLADLLYPRRCPVCDGIVPGPGRKICPGCVSKLQILTPPWCMRCGKKLLSEGEFCADCRRISHRFVQCRALYEYQSVAPSIYRMKYEGRKEYGDFFGEELGFYLKNTIKAMHPDGIVPIPLHPKRFHKRGYNQAEVIAKALGRTLDIPVYGKYLRRVKNTLPMKMLNPRERQNNLKKAFIIGQNDVKLKTIILLDDIFTTGSTVDEAASVLLQQGTEKIYVITLACGAGV